MVSDEEILERAFLSALRQHFKKPGPWLPVQTIKATQSFPDAKGIPNGQVWEVYFAASGDDLFLLSGHVLVAVGDYIDYWFPLSGIPAVVTEWTLAGAIYTATALSIPTGASMPTGYILTEGQILSSGNSLEFYVLTRRRFDLET